MLSSLAYLTTGLATSSIAFVLYLHNYSPLPINNSSIKSAFSYLRSLKNKSDADRYSQHFLYFLIRWEMITNKRSLEKEDQWIIDLSEKVMRSGFDIDGICLRGVDRIGMKGIEIGPMSFKEAPDESHLGLLFTKANILTFREQNPNSNLLIGLNLTPDKQVIDYVPHIIPNNLINALNEIFTINHQKQKINYITIDTQPIQQLIEKQVQGSLQLWNQLVSSTTSRCKKAGIPLFFQNKDQKLYQTEALKTKNKDELKYVRKESRMQQKMIDWRELIELIMGS